MATQEQPIIGKWYQEPQSGETFEVLSVNEDADTVEVRYLGRGRRMLKRDTWETLNPVNVKGPQEGPTDTMRSPSAPPPRGH
jgi:hypothetical protein